jgi:hypothetical protein
MSTGFLAEPCDGMTFAIASIDEDISAIFKPYFEQASVDIIAGPPAFDTITTPPLAGGTGCLEKAVERSNKSCIVSTLITPD